MPTPVPLSSDEAYDRAARKIWRGLLPLILLPFPLIAFDAWLRRNDSTLLYLLSALAVFWAVVAFGLLLTVRRDLRARTLTIANAIKFLGLPLLLLAQFSTEIIRDCGGGFVWRLGAIGTVCALGVLLSRWISAIDKAYQAALPPETGSPAPNHSAAPAIQSSGPSGPPII